MMLRLAGLELRARAPDKGIPDWCCEEIGGFSQESYLFNSFLTVGFRFRAYTRWKHNLRIYSLVSLLGL